MFVDYEKNSDDTKINFSIKNKNQNFSYIQNTSHRDLFMIVQYFNKNQIHMKLIFSEPRNVPNVSTKTENHRIPTS